MDRDEIYLIDFWRIFVRQWKWFALCIVLAFGLAYLYTHVVRKQWEASAWMRLAQVGITANRDDQDIKLEPIQRVLERLEYIPFQNQVLASIGIAAKSPEGSLFRHSMKLEPMPYAGPLIKITVRGYSAAQARALVEATVAQMRASQAPLMAEGLAFARVRASQVDAALRQVRTEMDRLQQAAAGADGKAVSPTQAMAGVLMASKGSELRTLEAAQSTYQVRLGNTYTFETAMAWPVYQPDDPVFPNVPLTWGIALLLGTAVGAMIAVARESRRSRMTALAQDDFNRAIQKEHSRQARDARVEHSAQGSGG